MSTTPRKHAPTRPDMAFAPSPARPRGRPRSLAAQRAALQAARDILHAEGPQALTMQGVAARAGVGKPTLYRWWPNREALTLAALLPQPLLGDAGETPPPSGSRAAGRGSPLALLRQQLHSLATVLQSPSGRHIAGQLAQGSRGAGADAFRQHYLLERRAEGRALLAQAQRADELVEGADLDIALDLIYGAVFFRLLHGQGPLDAGFVQQSFDQALQGLLRPGPQLLLI